MFQLKFADHHAGPDHRFVRRAGAVLVVPAVHGAVLEFFIYSRWRIGPGIPTASCISGACSTSPAARWCICRPGWQRWRAHVPGPRGRSIAKARRTSRRTFPSSCWAPECCGSAGSASTPGRHWRPTRSRPRLLPPRTPHRRRPCSAGSYFDWRVRRKPSALGACIGAVVGLVAITPAAGYVSVSREHLHRPGRGAGEQHRRPLKTKSTLDDTLDVFPCHGVGGMVGMLATGFLAATWACSGDRRAPCCFIFWRW